MKRRVDTGPPKEKARPRVAIPGAGEMSDLDERLESSLCHLSKAQAIRSSLSNSTC